MVITTTASTGSVDLNDVFELTTTGTQWSATTTAGLELNGECYIDSQEPNRIWQTEWDGGFIQTSDQRSATPNTGVGCLGVNNTENNTQHRNTE